jgi:hypothetical protein
VAKVNCKIVTFDIARTVDFSFENGSKYKLPEALGDGPHTEMKKTKKLNSENNINGA